MKSTMASFRMTGKPVPTSPSAYTANVFSPLRTLLTAASVLQSDVTTRWTTVVVTALTKT